MNRIYQGRVSKIQILSDDRKEPTVIDTFEGWELDQSCPLWKHHEAFQDAVNYYLLAFGALTSADAESSNPVILNLRKRLEKSWESLPHLNSNGKRSLRTSVCSWLGLESDATLEDAFAEILGNQVDAAASGNRTALENLLRSLLEKKGDGKIRDGAATELPKFCCKKTDANFSGEHARKALGRLRLILTLHGKIEGDLVSFGALDLATSSKRSGRSIATGEDARKKLVHYAGKLSKGGWLSGDISAEIITTIKSLSVENILAIPAYEAGGESREKSVGIPMLLLGKQLAFPKWNIDILKLLLAEPPKWEKSLEEATKASAAGIDPLETARGERGFVFRGFTALPAWNPVDPAEPVWKEFDIAAFMEALKSLNQFHQKTIERAENRAYLKGKIAILLGSGEPDWKPKKTESGETEDLPKALDVTLLKLADDLEERLTKELADTVVDHASAKTLHFGGASRTLIPGQWQLSSASLRGLSDIGKDWNKLLNQKGAAVSEDDLADVVKDHQRNEKNKKSIGSIPLFLALCDPLFWPLWRDESDVGEEDSARKTSNRFLYQFMDLHQAIRDFERAEQAVNLAPAEPRHSRRLWMFADEAKSRKQIFVAPGVLKTTLAVSEGGIWRKRVVHLHFSAPRLKRDELMGGETSQWLQPMTKALGFEPKEISAKFDSAVSLMPDFTSDGELRFLLNFPKTLDSAWLQNALGKAGIWNGQFNGIKDKNIHLHWPATASTKPSKENPWWKNPAILKNGFTIHSVDLGQRTAGAWALIKVTPWKPETSKPVRSIGRDESHEWFAEIQQTGMHRLPGEDQLVVDKSKQFSSERSGKAGRNASEGEYQNAIKLCQDLGCSGPDEARSWVGKSFTEKSLPEQNDSLLTLANRRLSRLATFHRWSCLHRALTDKSDDARTQIRIIASTLTELAYWQDQDVAAALKNLIKSHPYLETLVPETNQGPAAAKPSRKRKSTAAKSWSDDEIKSWKFEFHPDHFADFSTTFGVIYTAYRDSLLATLTDLANRVTPLRGKIWKWQTRDLKAEESPPYGELLWEEIRGEKTPLIRGQRGLSIARLEQLESLRTLFLRVNRAMDKVPGKLSKVGFGFTNDAGEPCELLLDKIDRMKEQRVNQTAHLILAQALGVRLKSDKMDPKARQERDIHGEYEPIPGRQPADFIVIENLDRYLTSQGRAPSENRRLMKWAHRAVRDKIKMLAEEPFGINVVEAPAAYSSRYCARSASPGSRCFEKPALDPYLREQLTKKSTTAPSSGHPDLRQHYQTLLQQFDLLEEANSTIIEANANRDSAAKPKSLHTLVLPKSGGPLFLSVGESPLIQADANAAINIGLRGIASPEAIDILHKIRTQTRQEQNQEKVYAGKHKHSDKNAREKAAFPDGTPIENGKALSKSSKSKGSPNFFYLPASARDHYAFDRASLDIGGKNVYLVSGVALHTLTDAAVLDRILEINNARLKRWGLPAVSVTSSCAQRTDVSGPANQEDEEDDIQY